MSAYVPVKCACGCPRHNGPCRRACGCQHYRPRAKAAIASAPRVIRAAVVREPKGISA